MYGQIHKSPERKKGKYFQNLFLEKQNIESFEKCLSTRKKKKHLE